MEQRGVEQLEVQDDGEHESETEIEEEPESGEGQAVADVAALDQGSAPARHRALDEAWVPSATSVGAKDDDQAPEIEAQAPTLRHRVLLFPAPAQAPTLAPRQAPELSALESTQASVPGIGAKGEKGSAQDRVPIHELDIIGWSPVRSGRGRSIRLRLGAPAPGSGAMTRYYTWVPEDQYNEWKKSFKIENAIAASRNHARIRAALRKRVG